MFTIPDNNIPIIARKRLGAAIKLAGMSTIAFLQENTAAAAYYAFDKKFEKVESNENIVIVNVGSFSTKLSLVNILIKEENDRTVTVLKNDYTEAFSGRNLDNIIAKLALELYNKRT